MKQYNVTGMSCAACSSRVEKAVNAVPGVLSCSVNLLTNSMGVEGEVVEAEIIKAVVDAGYGATVKGHGRNVGGATDAPKNSHNLDYSEARASLEDHETPKLKRRLFTQKYNFVVRQDDGSPFTPDAMTRKWKRFITRHKLPNIRLHDLRHSHATALIKAGVNPRVVQERLGHADVSITLNTYTHVLPEMDIDAAEKIDNMILKKA